MKIVLSREEIQLNVAFGLEFLGEVKPPDGCVWKCEVYTNDDGDLVAECVPSPQADSSHRGDGK